MATVDHARFDAETTDLQRLAKRHLWMHFTRMGAYGEADVPIIVRGDGCYVWDEKGNRYFDGLSALFCVNIGHGHTEVGPGRRRSGARARLLHHLVLRAPARDRAGREDRVAGPGRPQPHLLHLRRQRGSRDRRQARPPVPQGHRQPEQAQDHRARNRLPRHHYGSAGGDRHPRAAPSVRAVHARRRACPEHEPVPAGRRDGGAEDLAETVAHAIEFEGPETVAAVIMEPVQNAGGCFVPPEGYFQRVREICDSYNVLLDLRRGDLLVGPAGRVVGLPALRLPARHHHHGQGDHLAPTRRWAR